MKLGKLTALSAATLLAAGMTLAVAAEGDMTKGSSATQGKCWDSASNSVKDKAANKNQTTSGAKAPGGVTTGSAPSGAAATGSTGQTTLQRPASAAGLPNC